ncbi:LuxR C-terminal-related transcriptional regulator [Flavicella sediminum]|uniref:LuxR C-terminal-related transcriptional regulator n=1 Tax=Flavicella sediminum TaxID=2585141 RepID=UPI001AA078B6|nr:LuxR C-terminal-related transcriptional regulator [Flavicella sediminum]
MNSFLSDALPLDENLVENICFIKDSNFNEYSILEQKLIPLKKTKIGWENGVFWFKVVLKNSDSIKRIVFNTNESSIDFVEIYANSKLLSSTKNSVGLTNLSFEIENKTGKEYYLKVNFPYQVNFPLTATSASSYYTHIKFLSLLKTGAYYGFALMVLIINLFFYFSLEDKIFLFYSLFLVATNFGISHYDGVFNSWLTSDALFFTNTVSHFLIPLTGGLFAFNFLNLSNYMPKSKYFGSILLLATSICYVGHLVFLNYKFFIAGDILALLTLMYYWILGIFVIKRNDFAIFFVVGYSLVLIAAFLFVIPMDIGISGFSLPLKHVKFGALFEMLILTYAITFRVKKMHEENESNRNAIQEYIHKLNELEEQVTSSSNSENKSFEVKINEIVRDYKLTEREVDVLLRLYKGYTNKNIAAELFISLNTVKYHTGNIYQKLNIENKNEVISLFV